MSFGCFWMVKSGFIRLQLLVISRLQHEKNGVLISSEKLFKFHSFSFSLLFWWKLLLCSFSWVLPLGSKMLVDAICKCNCIGTDYFLFSAFFFWQENWRRPTNVEELYLDNMLLYIYCVRKRKFHFNNTVYLLRELVTSSLYKNMNRLYNSEIYFCP